MQSFKVFFALVVLGALCTQTATAQTRFGAQGAEGQPNRAQPWLVPSPDPALQRTRCCIGRPATGRFRWR